MSVNQHCNSHLEQKNQTAVNSFWIPSLSPCQVPVCEMATKLGLAVKATSVQFSCLYLLVILFIFESELTDVSNTLNLGNVLLCCTFYPTWSSNMKMFYSFFLNHGAAIKRLNGVKMLFLCSVSTAFPSEQCFSLFAHQVNDGFTATAMQLLLLKLSFRLLRRSHGNCTSVNFNAT